MKQIIAKILHDLSSPLTTLSLLSDSHKDIESSVNDLTQRLKFLRYIFVQEALSNDELKSFLETMFDLEWDVSFEDYNYNKIILIFIYLLKPSNQINVSIHPNSINLSFLSLNLSDYEIDILRGIKKADHTTVLWGYAYDLMQKAELNISKTNNKEVKLNK